MKFFLAPLFRDVIRIVLLVMVFLVLKLPFSEFRWEGTPKMHTGLDWIDMLFALLLLVVPGVAFLIVYFLPNILIIAVLFSRFIRELRKIKFLPYLIFLFFWSLVTFAFLLNKPQRGAVLWIASLLVALVLFSLDVFSNDHPDLIASESKLNSFYLSTSKYLFEKAVLTLIPIATVFIILVSGYVLFYTFNKIPNQICWYENSQFNCTNLVNSNWNALMSTFVYILISNTISIFLTYNLFKKNN